MVSSRNWTKTIKLQFFNCLMVLELKNSNNFLNISKFFSHKIANLFSILETSTEKKNVIYNEKFNRTLIINSIKFSIYL